MSLKAYRRDKALWEARTDGLKHPSNPNDRQMGRKVVKDLKVLSHKQLRGEGKKELKQQLNGM
jgi:hypothetical protein